MTSFSFLVVMFVAALSVSQMFHLVHFVGQKSLKRSGFTKRSISFNSIYVKNSSQTFYVSFLRNTF